MKVGDEVEIIADHIFAPFVRVGELAKITKIGDKLVTIHSDKWPHEQWVRLINHTSHFKLVKEND